MQLHRGYREPKERKVGIDVDPSRNHTFSRLARDLQWLAEWAGEQPELPIQRRQEAFANQAAHIEEAR